MHTVHIISEGRELELRDGDHPAARFHALWLRDHADDPLVRDPVSLQRRHSIIEIAENLTVVRSTIEGTRLHIHFSDGAHVSPSIAFLLRHRYDSARDRDASGLTTWNASLDPDTLVMDYRTVSGDEKQLKAWLELIAVHGCARLRNTPTKSGSVVDVVKLFGFVRETNYGRVFEVRSKPDAENLAYTDLGLSPHTDNPYRDPVPTLQLLHCLENDTQGGDTLLVDGFAAAEALREESPGHFEMLTTTPVEFTYRGDGVSDLRAVRPMIELDCTGRICAVFFNNRSMNGPMGIAYDQMPTFYAAYRALAEITDRASMQVRFAQQPGDLFIVDNRRILHGRTAFDGSDSRWLQGAYADIDGLLSTLRLLKSRAHPVVELIDDILGRRGSESYLGEDVTMSEHMLQTAMLAEQAGESETVVAAALLHDIGHYTGEFGDDYIEIGVDNRHQVSGYEVLKDWFPEQVSAVARWHVDAKRYLCAVDPDYFATLSDASVQTLALQGGPMSKEDCAQFETIDHFDSAVRVRRYDDGGKVAGVVTPPLSHYLKIVSRVIKPANESAV